jgi:hypothetical protein
MFLKLFPKLDNFHKNPMLQDFNQIDFFGAIQYKIIPLMGKK